MAADAKPDAVGALPTFEMQCVDCHNRAAHSYEQPDHAVDSALASGEIAAGLPFVKKTAVELLKTEYKSAEEADQKVQAGLSAFYSGKYPEIAKQRGADIQANRTCDRGDLLAQRLSGSEGDLGHLSE